MIQKHHRALAVFAVVSELMAFVAWRTWLAHRHADQGSAG